jgi:hypothetical protein
MLLCFIQYKYNALVIIALLHIFVHTKRAETCCMLHHLAVSACAVDDPIAAAIKRLAGSSAASSPHSSHDHEPSEEAKHASRERAASCAAARIAGSRAVAGQALHRPSLASPYEVNHDGLYQT